MTQIAEISGDLVRQFKIDIEATAGTADTWPLMTAERNLVVTGVRWIPGAAITGAATNNFSLQVQNLGPAAAGSAAVTTAKTYASGTNSVAYVPETYTIGAAPNLAAGDVLALVRAINGTGLAGARGTLEVQYRYR